MIDYISSGDGALILKAGKDISPATNVLIRKLLQCLDENPPPGVKDLIPSYNELMICYDPLETDFKQLQKQVTMLEPELERITLPVPNRVIIPVCYGGSFGPDLADVAKRNGLKEQEVIDLHSSVDYLVYMLGFTPGFCYLGGLDKSLATPRKEIPRLKIPAGSVGIAETQTGVYPIESPGGWQLIGRTPVKLFDPMRKPVFLVNPGDTIRFSPMGAEAYDHMNLPINKQPQ